MKTISLKNNFIGVLWLFIMIAVGACKNNEEINNPEDCIELNVKDIQDSSFEKSEHWNFSDKKICVLFGYGYNEESFVEEMEKKLSFEFGLAQDGGLIFPLVFPKDFKIAGRERISLLSEFLEEYELQGILLLGAPENTHNAVSQLFALYDGKVPFPVFSMFSQDNVLGTEWISDFVLEKMHISDMLSDAEEQTSPLPEDSETLIIQAIKYMALLDSPLPHDSDLIVHVQNIAGSSRTVSYYVDSDSGLRSANHFVFQDKE